MTLRILQGNLQRKNAAMDLMYKIAEEEQADIISEPNKKKVASGHWFTDQNLDVAIHVWNKGRKVYNFGAGPGYIWVECSAFVIYACYISPNVPTIVFEDFLKALRRDMRGHKKEVIVGGDFNAKSYAWGSKFEDKRGEILAEWLIEKDLIIHNKGNIQNI